MSRHERWGSLCHFCEESWPCETVTLRDENARLREQAEALATALETASDFVIAALWSSKRDNLLADIDAALRTYQKTDPPEGDDEYGMVKDAEQVADHLPPGWKL